MAALTPAAQVSMNVRGTPAVRATLSWDQLVTSAPLGECSSTSTRTAPVTDETTLVVIVWLVPRRTTDDPSAAEVAYVEPGSETGPPL